MVREVTAARPATPKRRSLPFDSSASLSDLSRLVAKSPAPKSGPSRIPTAVRRPRAVLGARNDNVAEPATAGASIKHKSSVKKPVVKVTAKPRPSLRKFSSLPHSSPTGPTAPTSLLLDRYTGTSTAHQLRSPSLQLDGNVTQLLDVQFPDMTFHAWEQDDTVGFGMLRQSRMTESSRGGLLTPDPSQQGPAASQSTPNPRPSHQSSASSSSSVKRNPISRLPTPPSSQDEASVESTPIATGLAKRVRPRPTATPPRPRNSAGRSSLAAAVGDVWEFDIPLRQEEEPSPNPRRKKSPRLQDVEGEQSPPQPDYPEIREIILTPPARTSQTRAKPKGRPSMRTPSLTLSQANATQKASTRRTIPASEPPARKRYSIHTPRARSSTPSAQDRARRSMTPAQRKVLSSRKLGVLEKEVEATPGDDELLLRGASARKRGIMRLAKDGVQSAGLRQAISASPRLPKEPPSPSQETISPRLSGPGDADMSFDAIGDLGEADGWASDNDTEMHSSDIEAGPEDTFIHANHRPLARDLSTQGSLRPLPPLLDLLEDEYCHLHASHAARPAQPIGEVNCDPEAGIDPPAVLYASDTHEDAPSVSLSTGQPVFEDPEISLDSPSFDCSADPSFSSDGSTQIEVDIPGPNDERIRDVTPPPSIAAASHQSPESIGQDDDEIALARLLREIHEEEALPGSTPAKHSPALHSPASHSTPSTSLAGDLTKDGVSGDWDDPSTLDPPEADNFDDAQEKEDAASPRKDGATDDDELLSLHFDPLPSPRRTPARIVRAEVATVNVISPLQTPSSVMSVLPTAGQETLPNDAQSETSVPAALPEDDKVSAHSAISREGSPVAQINADTSTLAWEDRSDLGHYDHTDHADRTDDAASDAWDMSGAARDEDRAESLHYDNHEPILHFEPLPSPRRTPVILRTREKTEPIEELAPMVDFRMRRANSLAPLTLPVLIRCDEILANPIDPPPQPAQCEAIGWSAGEGPHAEEEDAADYASPDVEEDTPCGADPTLSNHFDLSLDTPNNAPTAAEDSCSSAEAADESITNQVEDPADETQDAISREWDVTVIDMTHPSHDSSLSDHLRAVSDREADVAPTFEAFAAGVPDQSEDDQFLETPGEEAADIEVDGSGIQDDDIGTDHETTDEEEATDEEEQEYAAPKSDEKLILRLVLRSPVKVEPETIAIPPATTVSLAEETSHPTATAFMTAEAAHAVNADISAAIECPVPAAEPSTSEQIPVTAACSSPSPPSASPAPTNEASSSCSLAAVETETTQQSVFKYANANATHGVASLEWMLARRSLPIASQASSHPPSRLSKEVLPSSSPSHHSQAEPSAPSTPVREERSDLRAADVSTETAQDSMSSADSSIRQSAPSRSLLDEMSRAEADESMRSVVEVSSLDPRAAARAAAILKLNHAYIEHGRLPSSSSNVATPKRTPSKYRSDKFNSIVSASKLSKPELLLEAELEIVEARRSRSRSMSAAPSLVSDSPYLPGGWIGTPAGVKRKRSHREASPSLMKQSSAKGKDKEENSAPWGVNEWKKLEKVYRSEREAWLKEREVKPLPTSGLLGWARRASGVGSAPRVTAWDGDRVVNRFLKEEGKEAKGEWDRSLLSLRVNALTRRVEAKLAKESSTEGDRSPKRPRPTSTTTVIERPSVSGKLPGETTAIVPPSTIRRMFDYAFSFSTAKKAPVRTSLPPSAAGIDAAKGALIDRLKAVREEPSPVSSGVAEGPMMQQASYKPVTATAQAMASRPVTTLPHPSSPSWRSALAADASISTPGPSKRAFESLPTSRSTPDLSSLSFASQGTPSRLYPSLNPPLSARSTALAKLFDNPASSQTKSHIPVPIGGKKGSPKVSDLVKSFEDSGILGGNPGRPELPELRRVRSGR